MKTIRLKKILSVISACVFALTLAGCGNDNKSSTDDTTATTQAVITEEDKLGEVMEIRDISSMELVKEIKPDLKLGVEIKEYTEETVDITVKALKEYGVFENCWFYAFNGRIIRYLKETYNARTMGYPDLQMQEFDGYDAYEEIGISMSIARSEAGNLYMSKGFPMHMFCADTEEDVNFCIEKGASLITANDPRPLLKVLGR